MKKFLLAALLVVVMAVPVFATDLPLITDTANTSGKGKGQMDLSYQYSTDTNFKASQLMGSVTYGASDNLDFVVSMPWEYVKVGSVSAHGYGDIVVDAKYRFYNKQGLALAVKPTITLPTGSDGFGKDEASFGVALLATKAINDSFVVLANAGYTRNENNINNKLDLWSASIAAEYAVKQVKGLKVVADFGVATNPIKYGDATATYILGGASYAIAKNMDIALGAKFGLTEALPDFTLVTGFTFKF